MQPIFNVGTSRSLIWMCKNPVNIRILKKNENKNSISNTNTNTNNNWVGVQRKIVVPRGQMELFSLG